MKFDMHCHTKEGSIDARVDIFSYIQCLKGQGFDGMLVTDHNSYKGYRKWADTIRELGQGQFTVLNGIEYDTSNGGHMIAVLPDGVHCRLLELRGMSLERLEEVVHRLGGILGPAHPYGTGFFALMNNGWVKRHQHIIEKFDFIETWNACTHPFSNFKAGNLALRYKKPQFAGSDAHHRHAIGRAGTIFDRAIKCNNDLIQAVREQAILPPQEMGQPFSDKRKRMVLKVLGVVGYWIYNKAGALMYFFARHREMKRFWGKEREIQAGTGEGGTASAKADMGAFGNPET